MAELGIAVGGPQHIAEIECHLLRDLRQGAAQGNNDELVLVVPGADGSLVAGLTGATSYGWLLIKLLWVRADQRRRGLGRALMARALDQAKARGCHAAWLDTSNPEAMRFYHGLGFRSFGTLANGPDQPPRGHRRWFMKLTMDGTG